MDERNPIHLNICLIFLALDTATPYLSVYPGAQEGKKANHEHY